MGEFSKIKQGLGFLHQELAKATSQNSDSQDQGEAELSESPSVAGFQKGVEPGFLQEAFGQMSEGMTELFRQGLSGFSAVDPEAKSRLIENGQAKLREARESLAQGDTDTAKSLLKSIRKDFRAFAKAHPFEASTMAQAKLLGQVHQLQAEFAGVLGERESAERELGKALAYFQEATQFPVVPGQEDPELYVLLSKIHDRRGNYTEALQALQQAVRLDPGLRSRLVNYQATLNYRIEGIDQHREELKKQGRLLEAQIYFQEQHQAALALGDDTQVQRLEAQRETVTIDVIVQMQEKRVAQMAQSKFITREVLESLEGKDVLALEGKSIFDCVSISSSKGVKWKESYFRLKAEEKIKVLECLIMAGSPREYESKLSVETDETKRLYYQARMDLLEGNFARATLNFGRLKERGATSSDSEIQQMVLEAGGFLQESTAQGILRLMQYNEMTFAQRQESFEMQEYDKATYGENQRLLEAMLSVVGSEGVQSFEEIRPALEAADAKLKSEFLKNPVVQAGWLLAGPWEKPESGSQTSQRQMRAKGLCLEALKNNPWDLALRDPHAFSDLPWAYLAGGTLENIDSLVGLRVVIGSEGGNLKVGDKIYHFPPGRERVVLVGGGHVYADHLSRDRDYEVRSITDKPENYGNIRSDAAKGHPESYEGVLQHWDRLAFVDPTLHRLMEIETRDGLKRLADPRERSRVLLDLAGEIRERNGSYKVAEQIYRGLFEKEYAYEAQSLEESTLQNIKADVESSRSQNELRKTIEEQLKAQKKENPKAFAEAYPEGNPSEAQFNDLVKAATQQKLEEEIDKEVLRRVHRKDVRQFSSPEARQAYLALYDMIDPFDEITNVSSAGWDRIVDEVITTAVMSPVSFGIGGMVAKGLSSLSKVRKLATLGKWEKSATAVQF